MKQLWYGGTIYTMVSENETVEAVLVESGSIIATGALKELSAFADELIDLAGATMYPGFVDSHLHLIFYGEKLVRLDLSRAESAEHMLELIKEAAQTLPEDAWLFGEGWNEQSFAHKEIPTKQQLDQIRDAPIVLTRICHHVMLVNSSALEESGIKELSSNPSGGKLGRDGNGHLNGLLYDNATLLVMKAIPRVGEAYIEELAERVELAVQHMLSLGLTGAHTEDMHYFGSYNNPFAAFIRTVGAKQHFRLNLLRHHAVFADMMEAGLTYAEPFVEPGAMKIFADGTLGARTAALSQPYADYPHSKGHLLHTTDELTALVQLARTYGEAVAVHMIGDAATEQIIGIIEKHPPPVGKKDRLIHASVLRVDLIERMKRLSIIVDIQPSFVSSDFPWVVERLGESRLQTAYAWKKLHDAGIVCALGTDAPIEEISPLASIYAAVERKKLGEQHPGYVPKEKLTRYEAIRMYTYGSAQAIGKEHERGLIRPGYVADFSIFDRDLFTGTSEQMLEAKAVKTVVAGKIVYERK